MQKNTNCGKNTPWQRKILTVIYLLYIIPFAVETVILAALLAALIYKVYMGEGETKWKGLTNLKKDSEAKSMALEKEWRLPVEEKYWKTEGKEDERNFQLKVAGVWP